MVAFRDLPVTEKLILCLSTQSCSWGTFYALCHGNLWLSRPIWFKRN